MLNIQPVYPISLNDDWNLITRTILPVISQPKLTPDDDRTNGTGDTSFTAFLSPKGSANWIWGAGHVESIKWGMGARALPTTMKDRGTTF